MRPKSKLTLIFMLIGVIILSAAVYQPLGRHTSSDQQGGDSTPPPQIVKLIFIHHSTGENWLTDGYGDLGEMLGENNYFVSDTNYGWGPNGIGDRTDIPDWLEWFSGDQTDIYMQALFNEGEQNANYSRPLPDPGGENEIIIFKSCFPNSDLEGNPDDPPTSDGWLSVGHAKYVYNEILSYFGQHPEKLFVVITAPPLSDRGNAANARAFNLWLVNDWLSENDYSYHNVAVFDFYNVLTGKDGHHTFENGEEVHQVASKDTLHYPSGDDHPSKKGSQKATDEFIPLLNYFYNRWQAENPTSLPPIGEDSSEDTSQEDEYIQRPDYPVLSGVIDDFEGAPPERTNGWEVFWDESTTSELSCGVEEGTGASGNALRLDYQISDFSWGTCGLFFDQAQDWSGSMGLAFTVLAGQAGQTLHVDLYVEGPEGQESYISELDLKPRMEEEWVRIGIVWDYFQRVDWEANAGTPLRKPVQVSGIAFGFSTEDEGIEGVIWIDDLGWMIPREDINEEIETQPEQVTEESNNEETYSEESRGFNLPCIGSLAMPLGLVGIALYQRKRPGER